MKRVRSLKSALLKLAASALAVGLYAGTAAAACNQEALSLIKDLSGSWRGSGTVKPIGGAEERISCRISYKTSGARVTQDISCAATDYKIDAGADVSCEGSKVSGTWNEKVANNTGRVKGDIDGTRLNLDVDGANFQGRFAVQVNGSSKHSLTITQFDPGAGRHVPIATVSLRR
jgi:hypothetical protein